MNDMVMSWEIIVANQKECDALLRRINPRTRFMDKSLAERGFANFIHPLYGIAVVCVHDIPDGYHLTTVGEAFGDGYEYIPTAKIEKTLTIDDISSGPSFAVVHCARVAHEINRAYCAATGDMSQPAWEDAPQWQKDSACNGVLFHMEHPGAKPSDSHENWMREKVADGWVYGPVKDPEAKQHPCMVPYDDLPEAQRVKDHLFIAVVRAVMGV